MNNYQRTMNKEKRAAFPFLILPFFFLIFSFLFFTGCPDPLTSGNAALIPEGKGSFSLTLLWGRTILPATPDLSDFSVYNLAFTPTDGGTAVNVDRTNDNLAGQIILEPGTYNLVVNAYKDSGKAKLMARGTLNNIVITSEQNTAMNVTLEALLAEGTGTFKWEITVPQDVTAASMKIVPANEGGTNEETVTLPENNYTGNRTLNSGQYNLIINLESPNGTVVWKELLYVYQNLESILDFEFTETHFINANYTVTFESNEGSNVGRQSVLHGNAVPEPDIPPIRAGYTFGGWYTDNITFANDWDFDDPIIGDIALYAKWNINRYTVIFNADGGTPEPEQQTIDHGGKVSEPAAMTKDGYTFGGWYKENDDTFTMEYNFSEPVTCAITLYARWGISVTSQEDIDDFGSGAVIMDTFTVSNETEWDDATNSINAGGNNKNYIINITESFSIPGTFFTPTGINISIRGTQTLTLSGTGSLLGIAQNQRVIIRDLTLKGRTNGVDGVDSDNNASLITNDGIMELKGTAAITGNTYYRQGDNCQGGGVYNTGTFIMQDNSSITGNKAVVYAGRYDSGEYGAMGGGIYCSGIYNWGASIIMRGSASIADNVTSTSKAPDNIYGQSMYMRGGGVYLYRGTIRIEGGWISDNTASQGSSIYDQTNVDTDIHSIYEYGTFSGDTWNKAGDLPINNSTINVINGMLVSTGIADITAPVWPMDSAISFAAPMVGIPVVQTVTAQNWQISDDGTSGWSNITLVTADISLNGKYLRYYAESSGGLTLYSNVVIITVWDINNITNSIEWNAAMNYICAGGNDQSYTVCVNSDVGVPGSTANSFGTVTGLSVTLKGSGKLYLTSQGNMINLAANQTLIIDDAGLTLQGLKNGQNSATQDNNNSLLYVSGSNAKLELKNGTISGNEHRTANSYGGGVYITDSGSFTMSGGAISGNYAFYGGGVYVDTNCSFTMSSGTIGGEGTGNSAGYNSGGVCVSGSFTMNNGEISGNNAVYSGGGVNVYTNGSFIMNNGIISGNTTVSGGGVYVSGSFIMNNGIISGNNASIGVGAAQGGGVYITNGGSFTMSGGVISGNTASGSSSGGCRGGGVYSVGTFRIVTGTVYGSGENDTSLRNTTTGSGGGAALYGSAERGTFSGTDGAWASEGGLYTTNDTIDVINGELQ